MVEARPLEVGHIGSAIHKPSPTRRAFDLSGVGRQRFGEVAGTVAEF